MANSFEQWSALDSSQDLISFLKRTRHSLTVSDLSDRVMDTWIIDRMIVFYSYNNELHVVFDLFYKSNLTKKDTKKTNYLFTRKQWALSIHFERIKQCICNFYKRKPEFDWYYIDVDPLSTKLGRSRPKSRGAEMDMLPNI